jgi:hypothetical protein
MYVVEMNRGGSRTRPDLAEDLADEGDWSVYLNPTQGALSVTRPFPSMLILILASFSTPVNSL